jgi:gluconokinase
MSQLIVLFGPPGVGKTFIGEIIANLFAFHFYDADTDLTPQMIKTIQNKKIFTNAMRTEFLTIMLTKIQNLQGKHPKLVVAQALAKEYQRQEMLKWFPQITFLFIAAEEQNVRARLKARKDWITMEYAHKINKIFEPPGVNHIKVDNNLDRLHIINQLSKIL